MDTVHVFHHTRQMHSDLNHPAGLSLVAAVNVHDPEKNPLDYAILRTQNVEGSWSLKIGSESSNDVQVAASVWRNDEFIGQRSSTSGDLLVLGAKEAYLLKPWVGFVKVYDHASNAFSNEDEIKLAGIEHEDIKLAVQTATQPVKTPAITLLAHVISGAATIGKSSNIAYSQRLRHMTYLDRIGEDHLRLFGHQSPDAQYELQRATRNLYEGVEEVIEYLRHSQRAEAIAAGVKQVWGAAEAFMVQGAEGEPDYDPTPIPSLLGELNSLAPKQEQKNIFGYVVNLDERGEFNADLRDANGHSLMTVGTDSDNPEEGIWLVEAGYMKHARDLDGLTAYAVDQGIIPSNSLVVEGDDLEAYLHEQDEPVRGMRLG